MKLAAVTVILGVTLIAGCSSSGDSHANQTPGSAANKVAYIATVRSHLGLNQYTDNQLVDIAHSQCKMLETGSSKADVVNTMAGTSAGATYDTTQLADWVNAATDAYCPNK